jgi:hypothetical protein
MAGFVLAWEVAFNFIFKKGLAYRWPNPFPLLAFTSPCPSSPTTPPPTTPPKTPG